MGIIIIMMTRSDTDRFYILFSVFPFEMCDREVNINNKNNDYKFCDAYLQHKPNAILPYLFLFIGIYTHTV